MAQSGVTDFPWDTLDKAVYSGDGHYESTGRWSEQKGDKAFILFEAVVTYHGFKRSTIEIIHGICIHLSYGNQTELYPYHMRKCGFKSGH
ncbi:hypothetical protein CEXT_736541 [Caerostris extrusa]|uniref:Uncharacterized protein n=1 Tax=Caerostris extrusa TaxID=172846 RepID=A0AAV4SVR0_CAEEX|nr:hypothetical protein CEXT_736541 [Caerostris extrusa]